MPLSSGIRYRMQTLLPKRHRRAYGIKEFQDFCGKIF